MYAPNDLNAPEENQPPQSPTTSSAALSSFDCKLHYSAVFITRLHSLPRPTGKKRDLSPRKKTVNENRCFRLGVLT